MTNNSRLTNLDKSKTTSDMDFTEEELEQGALDIANALTFDPNPRLNVVLSKEARTSPDDVKKTS